MSTLTLGYACPGVGRISSDLAVYVALEQGTPFQRLAEACHIHARTVWRVIAKLRAAGLLANLSLVTGKSATTPQATTGKSVSISLPSEVPPSPPPAPPSYPPPTSPPTQTELLPVSVTEKTKPTKDEVLAYGKEFGIPRESCMVFLWQMAENNWHRGKYKVKSWQLTLKRWYVRGYLEVKH